MRTCPYCARKVDAETNVTGHRLPEEGDLLICAYCGEAGALTSENTIRKLNPAEWLGAKGRMARALSEMIKIKRATQNN